ncbi:MAG: dihydrolipoamide acetyltransferase family protein [Chloroflexi bacterium]|nr:dihydrolipoamide acetyltransferase family protein [Chloroflexota bacterium]MDA1296603.1 dihydrolipoamide acetyltransferase family protein [Chloroflexota bacterium]
MPFQIQMPHVGESVTEAVIDKWLKSPGDRVEKYEPLVEVITDKVAMEVPAPATGKLTRIIAQEGETVAMGAIIAEMEAEGVEPPQGGVPESGASAAVAPSGSPSSRVVDKPAVPRNPAPPVPSGLRIARADRVGSMITAANVGPTGGAFSDTSLGAGAAALAAAGNQAASRDSVTTRLSPVVRQLIERHGIDPSALTGTGAGGRITRADVLQAVEDGLGAGQKTPPGSEEGRLIKPSPVRRMIAGHMAKSFREIPHAWSAVEVDVTGLVACRAENRDSVQRRHGVTLTYLPFALAVTAGALRANPLLNSSWRNDGILQHDDINVGIAVAGRDGLVVPVIKKADGKGVLELAIELDSLVQRARDGRLTLDDVSGGTFTLNNTGVLGSVWGGAIINHPQAAILTTEAIVKRAVAVSLPSGDEVQIRPMMNICLSFDHRVIDGVEASAFLQDVRRGLEEVTADTTLE